MAMLIELLGVIKIMDEKYWGEKTLNKKKNTKPNEEKHIAVQ